ncbi:hypothetical protein DdX_11211 [Ditylenchus destructor]|uniref:Uncharacterized protein n=1 Tax=Ditylenchus destructor TaxID=166010 RepID=A0AAD4R1L2_9BILA|nr:hypothetical protein DdX_11211 [Ditylenchus destructor]
MSYHSPRSDDGKVPNRNAYQIPKIVIATPREVQMASHQEISTAQDEEQNLRDQELQNTPAPQNNTTMVTEIVAPSEVPSTSRQEMGRAEDEEQNRAIQSLLSFGDYDDPHKDFYSSESDDFCSTGDDEPGAQNPENLQLNKENTLPSDSASIAGPSSAGNAFQVPKIVIAPPKNRQVTPKAGPSNKSILVADRPALNERSTEKKAAAKHKIDSDEESSSSNSSQTSGSSSSSSPQFEPPIAPVFTRPQLARRGRKRTINRESTRRGLKRATQEESPRYNTRLRTRERERQNEPLPDLIIKNVAT